MPGMRIRHLMLGVILLDDVGCSVDCMPLMPIRRHRHVPAMMLRLGYRRRCMMLMIVMWGFRVVHLVPFDRTIPH